MATKRLHLNTQQEALALFGENDQNLRDIEKRFKVQFFVRPSSLPSGEGLTLAVRGRALNIDRAFAALEMRRKAPPNTPPRDILEPPTTEANKEMIVRAAAGGAVAPRTPHQREYVKAMRDFDLVVGVGPAGTGKTFLAVAFALAELQAGRFSRIVLTRPVVEAGEKLGFLPGDFYEKVHPYLRPLYDAFHTIVGPDRFRLLREDEVVEIVPLAYMRGRTLDDALIILDEAQNTTPEQMKMFLTRMGESSRMIVNGDLTQVDLEDRRRSGLLRITSILRDVEGVRFVHFTVADIVRHPLVQRILTAYDRHDRGQKEG